MIVVVVILNDKLLNVKRMQIKIGMYCIKLKYHVKPCVFFFFL